MAIQQIKHRWAGAVLWEGEAPSLREAVIQAVAADANLTRAVLADANLTDAVLTPIRDDLWAVLSSAPAEAAGLLAALREGRVDGSAYAGDCACLVGTIAKLRGCPYDELPSLRPNASRPAERFFLGIREGDTPETNPVSALAATWVSEWLERMRGAFGAQVSS